MYINKFVSVIIIAVFSASIFASDVSNFDIKGIKFGMSKNKVLKNIPCQNHTTDTNYIDTLHGKKLYWTIIRCKTNTDEYQISLNRHGKVYFIDRQINFNVNPSWKKLKKKLLNHFGSTTYQLPYSKFKVFDLCWGECVLSDSSFYYHHSKTSPQLVIYANHHENKYIHFRLLDPNIESENQNWYDEQTRQFEKLQINNATNIDL